MTFPAKTMPRIEVSKVAMTTIESKFDVYAFAPSLPIFFLMDIYTGKNAVVSIPAPTSSYS